MSGGRHWRRALAVVMTVGTLLVLSTDNLQAGDHDGQDGVANDRDSCARTPAGVQADARGCPFDRDRDQVFDYKDQCLDTPPAAMSVGVDEFGCPKDSDQDGLDDWLDRCPSTAAGERIDRYGCSAAQRAQMMPTVAQPPPATRQDTGRAAAGTVIWEVYFDSGSASIRVEQQRRLYAEGLAIMKDGRNRGPFLLLGHTDAQGSPRANKLLGRKRAESVRRWLIRRGIPASDLRVDTSGSGEPVRGAAQSRENWPQNRRVEIYKLR